jgi:hypothetical protein
MVAEKKEELKTLPTSQGAIRLRSAGREVKLILPVCPEGQLRDEQGNPTSVDCKKEMNGARGWWDLCESKGHNPYFRHLVKYRIEDNWVTHEDGSEEAVGKKRIKTKDEWVPNVRGISWAPNVSSGQSIQKAIARRGAKRLEEMGYREVCMLAECMQPAEFFSVRYGAYCKESHARVAAASVSGVLFPLVNLEGIDAAFAIGEVESNQLKSVKNYKGIDLVPGRWVDGKIVP